MTRSGSAATVLDFAVGQMRDDTALGALPVAVTSAHAMDATLPSPLGGRAAL